MSVLSYVKNIIDRLLLNFKWKKNNKHNFTKLSGTADINLTRAGNYTYGKLNVLEFNDKNTLTVGHFCSIAPDVCFIVSADHFVNRLSSYPFRAKLLTGESEGLSKGDIVIQDDVWIGKGASILSGVHICQGAIIAAGAVVSHDVPPYAIVGGVPAKVIKYRFSPDVIDFLLTLDYSKLDKDMIREHADDLYTVIDNMSLNEIKRMCSWFPKKEQT